MFCMFLIFYSSCTCVQRQLPAQWHKINCKRKRRRTKKRGCSIRKVYFELFDAYAMGRTLYISCSSSPWTDTKTEDIDERRISFACVRAMGNNHKYAWIWFQVSCTLQPHTLYRDQWSWGYKLQFLHWFCLLICFLICVFSFCYLSKKCTVFLLGVRILLFIDHHC